MRIRLRWVILGAVVTVVAAWVVTGHPLLFLFGTY